MVAFNLTWSLDMNRKQAEKLILNKQLVTLYDTQYGETIKDIMIESQSKTDLHIRLQNGRIGIFNRKSLVQIKYTL
jgi:hypothetical protein